MVLSVEPSHAVKAMAARKNSPYYPEIVDLTMMHLSVKVLGVDDGL
jgi:hypothetical protein